ncbi:TetR family transcriptional regulator [Bacillus sp. AFS002410]|uniref:TetR/AcrR family transcriptional regulator n=1 Tax=Bacillus sp. AFS002410 TaxID=2033481 RepID=UPI000BF21B89|nr:TetR/AcrR family transcriptional regulator [Bacillus sp. AFS002410]PEJ56316.1 TetR family transcriptional regulator [Bacillus sp. AFS002410]
MSNDKVESKRQLRSLMTRQKLLEAANEVFLEEGFQKATITQMIKRADIGYGTAYVHFKGKEDLLIVLMESVMERFYTIAETSFFPETKESAESIIYKQATLFLKMAEDERNMMQIFEQAIGISDVISDKWKTIREKFINRISLDISYAQEIGLARKELNPELVARAWFFTNEMYLWEIVRNEQHYSIDEIAKTITSLYTTGLY